QRQIGQQLQRDPDDFHPAVLRVVADLQCESRIRRGRRGGPARAGIRAAGWLPSVQRLLRAPHLHAAGSDQPGFARQRHGIRAGGAGALQGGSREPTRPAHRTGCPRLRQGTGDPGAALVEYGARTARARRGDPRTRRIEPAPTANRHDRNAELMKLTTAVAAGQLLFQIDPRPFQASLDQAQAMLQRDQAQARSAAADAERYAELVKQDYVTKSDYDARRAAAEALQAAVRADSAAVANARL